MSGRFIISLDCEGKWGMADKLSPHDHERITDDSLARIYDDLVALLDRHRIPTTFAFVMAFTLTPAERERFASLFEYDGTSSEPWLTHFRRARKGGPLQGWFQPDALERVRRSGIHEIACHGFCHRSFGAGALSPEDARIELDAADLVARAKRVELRTFVYPRNRVGHTRLLAERGYLGYREERPRPPGRLGMVRSLVDELNLWERPEQPAAEANADIVRIPAGFFFNWRFGARRRIPPAVTVQRWRNLLDRTAEQGGVAHLWMHPHNFLTAPETRAPFEAVLAHARRLMDAGSLEAVTQEGYCRSELARRGKQPPNRPTDVRTEQALPRA